MIEKGVCSFVDGARHHWEWGLKDLVPGLKLKCTEKVLEQVVFSGQNRARARESYNSLLL